MGQDLIDRARPPSDLHPAIYAIIAGLVLLFVIAAFSTFGDSGDADYLVAVVALFFIVAMGLPYLLWRTWRSHTGTRKAADESLREWSAAECDTWQCRLKGRDAAIQALLPIAAVAFGLTAIGIVLLLVSHGVV